MKKLQMTCSQEMASKMKWSPEFGMGRNGIKVNEKNMEGDIVNPLQGYHMDFGMNSYMMRDLSPTQLDGFFEDVYGTNSITNQATLGIGTGIGANETYGNMFSIEQNPTTNSLPFSNSGAADLFSQVPKIPTNTNSIVGMKNQTLQKQEMKQERVEQKLGEEMEKKTSLRQWKTIDIDHKVVKSDKMDIKHKTRREKYQSHIDETMYSSLRYVIDISIDERQLAHPVNFIFVKSTVPNAEVIAEEPIYRRTETTLVKQPGAENSHLFTGQLTIQFSNKLSYHKTQTEFSLQLSFMTSDNLDHVFLSKETPTFKIYARKPNRSKRSKVKMMDAVSRPRSMDILQDERPTKIPATSATLSLFKKELSTLVEMNQALNDQDRLEAITLVLNQYMALQGKELQTLIHSSVHN